MKMKYKNLIRYGLIFLAMFSIAMVTPENAKQINGFGIILVLAFCIGFMLSQSIKDIEKYLFNIN